MSLSPPSALERPTRVRHVAVAVTVLMAVLLYLDRYCVSFADRLIKQDLGLTETQMSWFLSLFFWAYALGQVPCGWLPDRFGARGVLACYILAWSLFTALIGVAAGVVSLLVMRAGCGLAQAGAFPASGSLLSKWVPLATRGRASGLVALGGRIGGAIAPLLTAYLIVLFVPLSTPVRFEPKDLLQPGQIAFKLDLVVVHPIPKVEDKPLLRVFEALPEAARTELLQAGSSLRPLLMEVADLEKQLKEYEGVDDPQGLSRFQTALDESRLKLNKAQADLQKWFQTEESTAEYRELLVGPFNDLMNRPNAFLPEDLAFLRGMEREALNLLAVRAAGTELTSQQSLRMNRLLFEAIFPAEISRLYVRGWRPVVIAYGLVGIAVAGVFWFYFRNTPAEHPGCNPAERRLIEAGKPGVEGTDAVPGDAGNESAALATRRADAVPIALILRSRSLWLSSLSQFGTNVGWLFLVTWLARYLIDVHEVPILERSWMVAIPPIAGIVGMFLGGLLTDWLAQTIGLRWGRTLPMALTRFTAAAAYVVALWLDSPWMATIAFACVFFSVDLGVSATWAFMQDVGGKHVGSILGWGNMWGNVGAAVAPLLYNYVLGDHPQVAQWHTMFLVCAGMFVSSGLAGLGIDATKPLERAAAGDRPT
ncbi:MAG: MFS transporter [Planctomycetales bacterium]